MRLGQAQALETEKGKMMNLMRAADAAAKTNEMDAEVADGFSGSEKWPKGMA